MAKTITKRDLVVIKVITAFAPYVAELTIVRYESRGSVAFSTSQTAYVKVPGNTLLLHLIRWGLDGQWTPNRLYVPIGPNMKIGLGPGTYTVAENREGYIFSRERR